MTIARALAPSTSPHRIRTRRVGLIAVLLGLLVLAVLASLAVGAKAIPIEAVWSALWSPTGTDDDIVVRSLRVPRTVLGVAVGIALGISGALMQGHTRNPLADPGLLGVTAGAAFLVVLGIYALGVTSLFGYVWFAFAGAFGASVAVFLLGALSRDGPTPVTLALAGVAVSALLGAFTSALILLDTQTLDAFRFWAVGSLAGRDAEIAVAGGALPARRPRAGAGQRAGAQPRLPRRGRRPRPGRQPGRHPLDRARRDHPAERRGDRGVRAHRVRRARRAARLPGVHRAGPPVAHPGVRAWPVPCCCWSRTSSGGSWSRPGELQVGIVLALVGAPFFVALVRRRRLAAL